MTKKNKIISFKEKKYHFLTCFSKLLISEDSSSSFCQSSSFFNKNISFSNLRNFATKQLQKN